MEKTFLSRFGWKFSVVIYKFTWTKFQFITEKRCIYLNYILVLYSTVFYGFCSAIDSVTVKSARFYSLLFKEKWKRTGESISWPSPDQKFAVPNSLIDYWQHVARVIMNEWYDNQGTVFKNWFFFVKLLLSHHFLLIFFWNSWIVVQLS